MDKHKNWRENDTISVTESDAGSRAARTERESNVVVGE